MSYIGLKTTGSMNYARASHTISVLKDGKVLVTGGHNSNYLNSAELYDPLTEIWTTTGNMNVARQYHAASTLTNGKVLVTGGRNSNYLNSAELYDPSTGIWTTAGS
jgi:N-acetylneuraminic acid mutarotase